MIRNAVGLAVAAAVLAGCGAADNRNATIWITRDRGEHVLAVRKVPSGLTAMQALDRVADITTRYSGKYVQSIDGIGGSLAKQRDWFYFVNGYEGDRSAAEYRLHKGDVEWWDFRSWKDAQRQQVVVGAFPEPFVHGWNGKRLPAKVVYFDPRDRDAARGLAKLIHGRVAGSGAALRDRVNTLVLIGNPPGTKRLFQADQWPADGPGDPVRFRYSGSARWLLDHPTFARFKYEVGP